MQKTSFKTQTAVIYARYSSHSQRDVAIEQQIRECEHFARRQGLEIVSVYEDHALTGTNDRRPGFQQMIKDAAVGGWSYVIVYSLDRFARDRYDSAVYKRELKNHGIRVLSAMEQISDDPTGVLMESLLEGLAEYYSKELSQKIRRGMSDNAEKCLVNGSVPLGYVRGEDGRYAIQEDEAAIVREIYRRVSQHEPLTSIIDDLNNRQIRTKTGKGWSHSSFNRLLTNERYTGVYIYGDTRIPGGIPAIVSPELWADVQYTISTKKNPRASGPHRRHRDKGLYLLTGKLYCGNCKSPMVGVSGHSKNRQTYFYYVCKGKRDHMGCRMRNIPRDEIERRIASALMETMLTDTAIINLADAAIAYQREQADSGAAAALRDQLAVNQKALDNVMAAIEAGVLTETTKARLVDLESEKRILTAKLDQLSCEATDTMTREQIIASLKIFQNGDLLNKDFQQALIDAWLVRAYVYDDHLTIVFNLGENTTTDLPFDIDSVDFADISAENRVFVQNTLVEPEFEYTSVFKNHVYIIQGLFVFQCSR